ncbi:MAG: hypothetical protein PHR94_02090 [Methylomonas lenta]|nr:hypothetical protein [Methylomonas lenta]
MKTLLFITMVLMLISVVPAHAGSLSKGQWTAGSCGSKPEAPNIDGSNIEAYNLSVTAINDWQQQSKTYFECMVKEANTDNQLISDTVNKDQDSYREKVDKIITEINAMGDALKQK